MHTLHSHPTYTPFIHTLHTHPSFTPYIHTPHTHPIYTPSPPRRRKDTHAQQVRYVHALAEACPFADASFDLVAVQFVVHECTAQAITNILQEAYRLLREGGTLVLVDINPKYGLGRGVCTVVVVVGCCLYVTNEVGGCSGGGNGMLAVSTWSYIPIVVHPHCSTSIFCTPHHHRSPVIQGLPPLIFTLMKSTEPNMDEFCSVDLQQVLAEVGFGAIDTADVDARHGAVLARKGA